MAAVALSLERDGCIAWHTMLSMIPSSQRAYSETCELSCNRIEVGFENHVSLPVAPNLCT